MRTTITIRSTALSLVLGLPERGMPEILAFGRAVAAPEFWPRVDRPGRVNGMDVSVPMSVLLPTGGLGFFGWPAIAGHRAGRDFILGFTGWHAEGDEAATVLAARDPVARIGIKINLKASAHGVISMSIALSNEGNDSYWLDRCMAASFLIPDGPAELTSFTGMWGREFQMRRAPLSNGLWMQENRRGRTSHDRFPGVIVAAGGETFGFHLGWSGNHQIAVDTLDDGRRLVHLGELFEPGEIRLAPGESYQSPVAYAGPDSAAFHAFVQEELVSWPGGRMQPRPVMLNTWEGNYFNHQPASLMAQASAAAALGIERFVVDDGWFGRRDDDSTSLGDWTVDAKKYPDGLQPLVEHVTGLGMQFGLWFEPEMVNPQSRLYAAHPDWVLQVEGRPLLLSRNQLVLDLTRPEVADYLFEAMRAVLASVAITYIKWDMNRDLTHVGGADGTARTSAQTRAVYALMARLRQAFPDVEIEACASGGGRVDYGVFRYAHRIWTSDCTDAFERLAIHDGAVQFVPPAMLGADFASSPCHQTGRRLTIAFRALVALAYHLGFEINPLELTPAEADELRYWIALYKRLRPLLHAPGAFFRNAPQDGRFIWGAEGQSRIVVFVAQAAQMIGEQPPSVRLPLKARADGGQWHVAAIHPAEPEFIWPSKGQKALLAGEISFGFDSLRLTGLPLPMLRPESGVLIELERIDGTAIHSGPATADGA
ncbi:MAG: alpha-galactosidase [Ancalomicrobiaceae bacterium]|nr:alpha-galactosidase [Ancalomicrobiaceae bacterium]